MGEMKPVQWGAVPDWKRIAERLTEDCAALRAENAELREVIIITAREWWGNELGELCDRGDCSDCDKIRKTVNRYNLLPAPQPDAEPKEEGK